MSIFSVRPGLRPVIAAALIAVVVLATSGCAPTPEDTAEGNVARVLNAETLEVTVDGTIETVRLLNIDAPTLADANEPDQCLASGAAGLVETMLPAGASVRLEFDEQRTNADGQTVAAIFVDDESVNESLMQAGLAVPVTSDTNNRFIPSLNEAHERARADEVGLFSTDGNCTVPAQVLAVAGVNCISIDIRVGAQVTPSPSAVTSSTDGSAPSFSSSSPTAPSASQVSIAVGTTSRQLSTMADAAADTLARAVALKKSALANQDSLIWRALNAVQRASCITAINEFATIATGNHSAILAELAAAQKADAARIADVQRVVAEAARIAEEQRVAAQAEIARLAEVARVAAESEAARIAEEVRADEAARVAAAQAAAQQEQAEQEQAEQEQAAEEQREAAAAADQDPSSDTSNDSSGSGGSDSGYTGPRCYAPGGQTWTPC